VPVGATLVRHSTPAHEVAETYAKAAGVMAALGLRGRAGGAVPALLVADSGVCEQLERRNATLAQFWLRERVSPPVFDGRRVFDGRQVLVVDAEDTFTGMLAHQLRALGLAVTLRSYREDFDVEGFDLVVVGPGPGDPGDLADPKIAILRRLVDDLLASRRPMLAICLGHQVLAGALGLPLHRKDSPYQGMQCEIDFFGRVERVGFYSTYTAVSSCSLEGVEVSRDPRSGEVHALRGPSFAGVQFHPESVLTEHGIDLLRELVAPLVGELVP
jgi:phenazine biosynthesis protein phzE